MNGSDLGFTVIFNGKVNGFIFLLTSNLRANENNCLEPSLS